MGQKRGKILVIRGGAIGDFILTLPAIAALRSVFPETHLEVLGYPMVAELARQAGIIDGFRSIDARPMAGFFARNGKLDPELSAYFESFALIFSYLYDPDEIFRANLSLTTTAQFIQGVHRPDEKEDIHATTVFLKPLEKMAIFNADPVPRLNLPSVDQTQNIIAIHPGSGSEKKNWPITHWIQFIKALQAETKHEILVLGGEADADRIAAIQNEIKSLELKLLQNRPLAELAVRLSGCKAFIGHDSGISHIAAALGLPALLLWGPSKLRIWGPLNQNVKILSAPDASLEKLEVEVVRAAFYSLPA